MLLSFAQGTPLFHGIGNRSKQTYDEHPGTLVRMEQNAEDDRGRFGNVAVVILQRTRLDGETYLAEARILEQYVYPRDWKVDGLDDTPLPQLIAKLSSQRREFVTRGDAIEIGEASEKQVAATVSDDVGDLPF